MFRNNSGGFYDETGRFVRFGLGGFIPEKHKLKSADFIGWKPEMIMPYHVGHVLPIFTAIETKPTDWKFNAVDKHSLYQKNFLDMVLNANGNAGFASDINDFKRIVGIDQI